VIVQKKYVPVMLLRAYRAAELRVNMLKDNTKMDIKEMALNIASTILNWINIALWSPLSATILLGKDEYLAQLIQFYRPQCKYTVLYRLFMFSYTTLTTHRCT
jgi:hypothetical protein